MFVGLIKKKYQVVVEMPRIAILPDQDGFKVGPEDLKIVVTYQWEGGPLTEEQQNKFIRKLKREKYYYDYLSRKFSYKFQEGENSTKGIFLWKGGNGDHSEASHRVLELLATKIRNETLYNETLPEGVSGKISIRESSPYVSEI